MDTGRRHTWHIPARPESVAEARRSTGKALADWGYYGSIVDDIVLMVSELVTNAVVHGAPDITLSLWLECGCVCGRVSDRGPGRPRLVTASDTAEHGRGLAMVAELARTLGWGRTPGGGKRVWFTYPLPEV